MFYKTIDLAWRVKEGDLEDKTLQYCIVTNWLFGLIETRSVWKPVRYVFGSQPPTYGPDPAYKKD